MGAGDACAVADLSEGDQSLDASPHGSHHGAGDARSGRAGGTRVLSNRRAIGRHDRIPGEAETQLLAVPLRRSAGARAPSRRAWPFLWMRACTGNYTAP